jgi:hypothetical protein
VFGLCSLIGCVLLPAVDEQGMSKAAFCFTKLGPGPPAAAFLAILVIFCWLAVVVPLHAMISTDDAGEAWVVMLIIFLLSTWCIHLPAFDFILGCFAVIFAEPLVRVIPARLWPMLLPFYLEPASDFIWT